MEKPVLRVYGRPIGQDYRLEVVDGIVVRFDVDYWYCLEGVLMLM